MQTRHLFREWEDGAVFYDRLTGDTHALDPLALEVLKLPASHRVDAQCTAEAIAKLLDLPLDSTLKTAVDEAFSLLTKRELI